MSEVGTPPPGARHFGTEQARRCVDRYIDAWNEPLADRRGQILSQVMTDESRYVDPNRELDSRAGLVEYIGEVLNQAPGRRILRTSEVDAHHLHGRFNWCLVHADGTRAPESVDFIEFATDGRIHRVTGFFGPLTPSEAPKR